MQQGQLYTFVELESNRELQILPSALLTLQLHLLIKVNVCR